MSTPTIPDLPDVDPKNPDSMRRFMGALKEIVQTREGRRGQKLDKAVTFRDLQGIGIVQQQPNTGGFVPGPATGGGGGTGGGSGSTDLSPAPAVDLASVSVTAGFASIFIEWAAQTYTTGGGNAYTEVWAATYSGTGPLPTFADAKLVNLSEAPLFAYTVGLGVQVHIWLINVTRAGKPQLVPTGGTNGKSATTGKIGNNDLGPLIVDAQNIASGAVTPGKLSVQIGGGNLVGNSSFEADSNGDGRPDGWSGYNSNTIVRVPGRRGGYALRATFGGGPPTWGKGINGGAFAWRPNTTYVVSFWARASYGSVAYPMNLKWNIGPVSTEWLSNPDPDATVWKRYIARITWGASVEPAGPLYIAVQDYDFGANVSGYAEFDDVQVEEGDVPTAYAPRPDEILPGTITQTEIADNSITTPKLAAGAVVAGSIAAGAVVADKLAADSVTAGKIAAGAIAAGSAAIADGAIINAMIADATIESAKIKTLSADKITAGRIAVGQYIASAGFNSGYSGWAIWGNGDAEFNNITVRNSTVTGTVYAGAGTIGGIRINAYQFNNDDYVPGTSGFALFSNGGAEFNQGCTFRGAIDVVGSNGGPWTRQTNQGTRIYNGSGVEVITLGVF